MTHDEIQAELSAFALGALDPPEQRAVEEHLATGCAHCRQELRVWHEIVGSLALVGQEDADADATAAPDLKPALLQRIHPTPARAKVFALPRWSLIPLSLAAAALLAVGITRQLGLRDELAAQHQLVASLRSEAGSAREHAAQLTQQLAAMEHDVGTLRAALAAAQESLAILQKPGLQMVRMQAPATQPAPAPRAEAHALISTDTRRALFYAFDLPAVPADKAYELWWITEKEGPVRAGLFAPDQRGFGRLEMPLPTDVGLIQAAAVTIEPAAGVAKPTGPMVLTPVTKG